MSGRTRLVLLAVPGAILVVTVVVWLAWPSPVFEGKTADQWAAVIGREVREIERESDLELSGHLLTGLSFRSVGALEDSHRPSPIFGPPCPSVAALAAGGSDSAGVIASLLRGREPEVRAVAACIVARRGRDVPDDELSARRGDLRSLLSDASPVARRAAAFALGAVGDHAEDGERMVTLARDPDPGVRGAACWSIGMLEPPPDLAVPALQVALDDASSDVRAAAAMSLAWRGAESLPALPDLIRRLDDESGWVLGSVLEAIGALGPAARDAVPHLVARSDRMETRVVRTLSRIEDPRARETLLQAAVEGDEESRQTALAGLGRLSRLAPDLVTTIIDRVTDENAEIRRQACWVLSTLEPDAAAARAKPLLRGALRDPVIRVRILAARALATYGGEPEVGVAALLEVLRTEDDQELMLAAASLADLGPLARHAIPALEVIQRARPDSTEISGALAALRGESGD